MKLNPDKLLVSEEVEFGGSVMSAEIVKQEIIGPKDKTSLFGTEETYLKKGSTDLLRNVGIPAKLVSITPPQHPQPQESHYRLI